jgi:TRAP-type C4-dicarboxylate transport system substrate-binding protein
MTTRHPALAAALGVAVAVTTAAPTARAGDAWTFAITASPGTPPRRVAEAFAACVRDGTVGRLTLALETEPDGPALAAAVAAGTPRLATVRLADVTAPDQLFELAEIPGLAPDAAAADRLWTAARMDLERVLAARGLRFLYGAPLAPAGLFLAHAPSETDDLARLRLAAADDAGARLIARLGAAAGTQEPQGFAAVSAAVAAGQLDGFAARPDADAIAAAPNGAVYVAIEAGIPREVVVAHLAAFDALDADAKTVLVSCADKAAGEALAAAVAARDARRAALAARDIQIVPATAAVAARLGTTPDARLADWLRRTGVAGKAIVDSYRAK